jgi:membrane fusion protein, copper/silver efflux system
MTIAELNARIAKGDPMWTKLRFRAAILTTLALLLATIAMVLGQRFEPSASAVAEVDHSSHSIAAHTASQPALDGMESDPLGRVLHIEAESARSFGMLVVEAQIAPLRREIRTTGHVAYDETRLAAITPKVSGFVERLHVDYTGRLVRRGQPLLEIYSPELVAAQEELLSAVRMEHRFRDTAGPDAQARASGLVEAARRRLASWDVSSDQIRQVEETGRARRTLTLHAPADGVVTEKMVVSGQAIQAGMPIYRLADLARVWIEADVYEQDLRFLRIGDVAIVEIGAYPDEPLRGRVTYVYPEVRVETRTATVRIELENPRGRAMPGMYATVRIEIPMSENTVVVPRDAVMHSGTHAMVFVEEPDGTYRAREVRVGADVAGQAQILSGLAAGERVVQRANFLLDSESRLLESMGTTPGMNH